MNLFKNKAIVEVAAWGCVFGTAYCISIALDLHERLDAIPEIYHWLQFDELLTALMISGLTGHAYALARIKDLSREISKRRDAESRSEWTATHDALTGLLNRRALSASQRKWKAERAGPRSFAVYSIDLDGFKKVNDLLGHAAGDAVLKIAADRLRRICGHDAVYRLGGDEFLVLMDRSTVADPLAMGGQIVSTLSGPMDGGGATVELGASVGLAYYPEHHEQLETVINYSDCALSEAKKGGKHRFEVFSQSFEDALVKRTLMEVSLKQALKMGAIEPYFQPLVDLKTGKVIGFEALARWQNARGSFVPPSEFITLAEETGLIVDLTEQLFRAAVSAATSWPSDIVLSFNLSPVQLGDRMLPLRLMKTLGEFGLSPHRLEVEVTETALMKEPEVSQEILAEIAGAGVRIALDDFGSGYSSLSRLADFSFDKIKIDRDFVAKLSGNDRQDKVVRAVVALGKSLSITTTAEGIEDVQQLEHLKALGCDIGQGYLFGKAVPADEVDVILSGSTALQRRRTA